MVERWHLFGAPVDRRETWLITLTVFAALLTPAIVGTVVKLELDRQGSPTLAWHDGLVGMVPLTLSIAIAWLGYGILCRWLLHRATGSGQARRAVTLAWLCGLAGGVAALAPVLHEALQQAAYALMIAVLRPDYYWRYVLGGALVGGLAGGAVGFAASGWWPLNRSTPG